MSVEPEAAASLLFRGYAVVGDEAGGLERMLELHKPGMVSELVKAHEAAQAQWQDPDPFLLYTEGELPQDF